MTAELLPRLAPHVRFRLDKTSGGQLLLAPERGYRLNESAAAILRLCDGRHSVGAIARVLAPPGLDAHVLSDVERLVERLRLLGLLTVFSP